MKAKSGRVQARHLPGVRLAALLLLSSPASAGLPFITDDPEPADYLHWEVYTFSQGMRATGEISGVVPPSCDCNYGVLPNVHLHVQPGMAVARANGGPLPFGPGDTEFGIKYRFIEQDKVGWVPDVAIYPLLEAPTGETARGLATAGPMRSCRSGFRRISATGRPMAAAATGSTPAPATGTTGSRVGCWSARSLTNLRSEWNCSTRRPTK